MPLRHRRRDRRRLQPIDNEQTKTLAGGRYATTRFFDTPDRIAGAWQQMMDGWLPQSGFGLGTLRPTFEYDPPEMRYDEGTGAFECDIVIPIQ